MKVDHRKMSSNADADSLFEDELRDSSIEKIGNTEEQDIKTESQIRLRKFRVSIKKDRNRAKVLETSGGKISF